MSRRFFYSAGAWLNQGAFDIIYIERREKKHGKKDFVPLMLLLCNSYVALIPEKSLDGIMAF